MKVTAVQRLYAIRLSIAAIAIIAIVLARFGWPFSSQQHDQMAHKQPKDAVDRKVFQVPCLSEDGQEVVACRPKYDGIMCESSRFVSMTVCTVH